MPEVQAARSGGGGHNGSMDAAVQDYIDAIDADHRPLFDRVHGLILAAHPDVAVTISYQMPTYKRAGRRLYLATWTHGVSLYGWDKGHDGGFAERHPELLTGKGTLRLRPADAEAIADQELTDLVRAALDG